MTIRRQYSLPNCTLILEGLSDTSPMTGGHLDARPLMTILVNAECHLTGREQPLSGGRDFFESLVRSVSSYAQEFLSQVHHPKLPVEQPVLVKLQKVKEKNLHRLTLLSVGQSLEGGSNAAHAVIDHKAGVHIDLTTVQLFDLVEAVDQFLADRRTLPDLSVELHPVSRRYRKADQPVTQRAAPAALGMTSLTLAAIAFFLVPVPQVRPPKPSAQPTNTTKTTSPSPNSKPQATATPKATPTPPKASDLEKILTSAPEITDPTQLRFLQRNLYNKLNKAWKNPESVVENLEYRLGVGKDGAIVGYKPVNAAAGGDAAKKTPLPDLLYIPATGSIANKEAIAQFRVLFKNTGILQISPWRGYTGEPSLGPEITDAAVLNNLNSQVYNQLRESWRTTPTFPEALIYRVAVTENGVIADYEPKNQPAWDYFGQTPIESLLKPEAAGTGQENQGLLPQKPLAQFRVVFKPSGVLEVSPLRGYR